MEKSVKELKQEDFRPLISGSSGIQLVEFGAPWCPPCKALLPVLEDLARSYPGIEVYSIDVDQAVELASQFNIKGLPTVLLFSDGRSAGRWTGKQPADIYRQAIERELGQKPN